MHNLQYNPLILIKSQKVFLIKTTLIAFSIQFLNSMKKYWEFFSWASYLKFVTFLHWNLHEIFLEWRCSILQTRLLHRHLTLETTFRALSAICRLWSVWFGWQRSPLTKTQLRWRGTNSISKFDHHNINGGAVLQYMTSQVEDL
jgi:hypothetical protein